MAATQLMIFTAIPHSFKLNPASMPVAVTVSPRLRGEDKLGAYPDWLRWTALPNFNRKESWKAPPKNSRKPRSKPARRHTTLSL